MGGEYNGRSSNSTGQIESQIEGEGSKSEIFVKEWQSYGQHYSSIPNHEDERPHTTLISYKLLKSLEA